MRTPAFVLALTAVTAGCSGTLPSERDQRVLDALADDNYAWGLRDPDLVAQKLRKMQRGPYEWLRGTAGVYWRDLLDPGARPATAFGDEASSRVLMVADPHPENVGTFRATDGTMLVDKVLSIGGNVRLSALGFILDNKGLMYNLTLEGSKITRINK